MAVKIIQAVRPFDVTSLIFFLLAPPKKRGRAAQPKEPKPPKPPKVPKVPKPPKTPKEPKPPKVPKAAKPAKDPNAPKAKPGPKPKKGAEAPADGKQEKIDESFKKVKRKINRFKGMSEEEVMTKTLPDLLDYNLDYVIVRAALCSTRNGFGGCKLLKMRKKHALYFFPFFSRLVLTRD